MSQSRPASISPSLDLTSAFPDTDQKVAEETAITAMIFITYLTRDDADWFTEISYWPLGYWLNDAEFSEFYRTLPRMAYSPHNCLVIGMRELVSSNYLYRRDARDDDGNIYLRLSPKFVEAIDKLARSKS
jgi:hypothetical protein